MGLSGGLGGLITGGIFFFRVDGSITGGGLIGGSLWYYGFIFR